MLICFIVDENIRLLTVIYTVTELKYQTALMPVFYNSNT